MSIQERGDAMLTAYVNKDFGTVEKLWTLPNGRREQRVEHYTNLK